MEEKLFIRVHQFCMVVGELLFHFKESFLKETVVNRSRKSFIEQRTLKYFTIFNYAKEHCLELGEKILQVYALVIVFVFKR